MDLEKNKKFIIGIILLIAVILFAYKAYSVNLQKNKEQAVIQEQQQKEQHILDLQQGKEELNKVKLGVCLYGAEADYHNAWISACQSQFELFVRMIDGCGDNYFECKSWQDLLKMRYKSGESKDIDNCLLDTEKVDSLKEELEKDESECYNLYE